MEQIKAEIRLDNQIVSGWLTYYHERKQNNEELRHKIIEAKPIISADRVSNSKISDQTGQRASKLADDTRTATDWLWCVDACRSTLGPRKRILLDLVQESATRQVGMKHTKRFWLLWVQRQYYERHGCWLDEPLINKYWFEIVDRCARIAGKKGLFVK